MNLSATTAIIGGGPAGLTAAYLLAREQVPVTVIEANAAGIGGLARTVVYKDVRFDIGGHRFFSKIPRVNAFWRELLPDDFPRRPRASRIYYRGQYFSYPLRLMEALVKLGPIEALACAGSYAMARAWPKARPRNFSEWVTNRFGRRLFTIFFKSYTEKVWGISCTDLSADWAAQRIQNLSLSSALWDAIPAVRSRQPDSSVVVPTLIKSFHYPRLGAGMMWEACAAKARALGATILMGRRVVGCAYDAGTARWRITHTDPGGETASLEAEHVIWSASLADTAAAIDPPLSSDARDAASRLVYRDFVIVALVLRDRGLFTDNWIYVHDPDVQVARIQNFKAWSPDMVADASLNCYGLEYFCAQGDRLWAMPDDQLIDLARRELVALGLARAADVLDGCVMRAPRAYPVYNGEYATHRDTIRRELDARFPTFHAVGRNGLHAYHNMDHATLTAMLTVENILAGRRVHDVWSVNIPDDYMEGHPASPAEFLKARQGNAQVTGGMAPAEPRC